MKCPNCGSEPYSAVESCASCGHVEFKPLSLIKADGSTVLNQIRGEVGLNSSWASRPFGDERRYWSNDWQFKLIPVGTGWQIESNDMADNKTILNGVLLVGIVDLNDGDSLCIGNAAATVRKCEMTIQIAI